MLRCVDCSSFYPTVFEENLSSNQYASQNKIHHQRLKSIASLRNDYADHGLAPSIDREYVAINFKPLFVEIGCNLMT